VIKAEDPIVVVPLSNLGATPHTQNLLQLEISDGKFHLRGSLISMPKGGLKFKGPKSEVEKLKNELNRLQRGSDGNGNGGNGGRRNGSDILQT
jgi:hypothetical protein